MSDQHLERLEAKLDLLIAIQAGHPTRLQSVDFVPNKDSSLAQAIKEAIDSLAALQASTDRGFAELKKHIDNCRGLKPTTSIS